MRYNKKFLGLFCSATFCLLFLSLVACGDGDNKVIEVYDDSDQVLAAGKKLSTESCDTSAVGKKVFVADSGASYFCDGNDWVKLKGGAGDEGPAGLDGKDGASGEKGVKGDSAQIPGYTGPMGEKGERGDSSKVDCGIASDSAGVIVLKCSDGRESKLYSALCLDSAYNPEEKFCVQGVLFDLDKYFVDVRDNQVYRYAVIGEGENAMTWMTENLNYAFNDGKQSWCYDNKEENCKKYGRLYTWAAVLNRTEEECGYGKKCNVANPFHGLCPEGWHVSSTAEWLLLFELEKEEDSSGAMLRSKDGWNEGVKGTDDLGFAALPGGYYSYGSFYGESTIALFWTSNFIDNTSAQSYGMTYDSKDVTYDAVDENRGLSLRCVKDYQ